MALTETAHPAEFILSEANGQRSREEATVPAGQEISAGEVISINTAGEMVHWDAGTSVAAHGVAIYAADATSAAVAHVAYIARDAEVNGNLLDYPANQLAAAVADLALVNIRVRGGE